MSYRWFLRMKRLAQNPPSETRVKLVLGIILLCILLYLVERFIGWPDFLTSEPVGRRWKP